MRGKKQRANGFEKKSVWHICEWLMAGTCDVQRETRTVKRERDGAPSGWQNKRTTFGGKHGWQYIRPGRLLQILRFRTADSELVVSDHDERTTPGLDRLALKHGVNATGQCITARRAQPHQQEPCVRSRCEAADIGKIQILSDEETLCRLGEKKVSGTIIGTHAWT